MVLGILAGTIPTIVRNRFTKTVAAGFAVLLVLRMTVMADPVNPAHAGLADDYAAHLRSTKGIMDIRTVHQSGLGSNGLEVVIVSAGFKAEEMDAFRRLSEQFAESLFSVQPWGWYRNVVNVHAVFVGDEGTNTTKLRVSGHDGHVLHCDNGVAVEYARYAANAPATVVMHNSGFSTASCGTWGVATVNKGAAHSAVAPVHELGHCLAGLGDEYIQRSGPFDGTPESLQDTVNVTAEANPRLCKWNYWTEEEWPGLFKRLKRPEGRVITNSEGAGWPAKIYRPENACMMRCNRNCFCMVCNETLEANFFRNMDLFKTVTPETEDFVLWKGETVDFRVCANDFIREPPEWLASRLDFYLDGKLVASSGRGEVSFRFASRTATPGVHQLGANLNLESDSVRRDFGFMSGTRAWRVKVIPHAKPRIAVASRVSISSDGEIDVPVAIKHGDPALFGLKMAHAPENAAMANGRFKWKPEGLAGSWKVDFCASFEQQDVVTESMEIIVTRADGAKGMVEVEAPEAVDAVTQAKVAVRLKARSTAGDHVLLEPVEVPPGVELDRYTGELSWTPRLCQVGPQLLRFRIRSGLVARETNVLFRVRRAATPSPVSYCNTYIPQTLEYLKQLQQSPLAYLRLFETLRLLRDRYARIYDPALAEAAKLYVELGPGLRDNCISELSLHAWAFADKPEVLKWMRLVAEGGTTGEARTLINKLDLMAELKGIRTIETSGGPAELAPLMTKLVTTSDQAIRSAIERAVASVCGRAEDKQPCQQAVLGAFSAAKGRDRIALLPLLPLVKTPAAMDVLMTAAGDQDRDLAAKAVQTIAAAGDLAQLAPLVALLAGTSGEADRSAIERAAAAVCRRVADREACQQVILPALVKANGPARTALVRLLPLVPTPAAVEALTAAAGGPDRAVAVEARRALDYVNGLGATDGYISSWMLSGPYTGAEGGSCFDVEFAPEKKDGRAKWQRWEAKIDKGVCVVPLGQILGGYQRAAYMKATIRSEKAQEVIFEAGSDDGLKVWLNGKVVHSNNSMRPLKPADDKFKARLKAGDNVLLCKINQGVGEWGACVRIRAADGGDALGVSVLPPQER